MRVVVVGATGSSGTAVLRALDAEPSVTSVLGIARRLPDQHVEPYSSAEWARFDIGREEVIDAGEEEVVDELADLFEGADAVIHLAWILQPNHDRTFLRRTNVDGTTRVARACARAGVGHLVAASSVGAYSPVQDDEPRDESWHRGGVETSHYSVDKVAQERVLDWFEVAHPEVVVTRLRPALIFQRDAGAEIVRYFIGSWVPQGLLRPGRLPIIPLPTGLRLQVVHAEDVARAYVLAVTHRAGGAFNIAGDPVLYADDLAQLVDHGRLLEISPRVIRPLLSLAWQAHLVPTDPGWLDMGMGAPLMSTTRARTVLGWSPRHSSEITLEHMLDGIADGRGQRGSVPLRDGDTPVAPRDAVV
ncbi:NAD-dependent epimerase/dehydratase family protein [Sanguibacter sp. 25GB23B1]|uniref:NAD-dependent epimerase/dehydratase family protein n=1 Tax=unclassified Sanguibacter TaxID=2645534 RepID=UPI0032AFDD33